MTSRPPRDVDDPQFAWRESGDGPLVVLLHGLGGSRISWEPQLEGLVGFRVAAWDMPGYGAGPPLDDVSFSTLAQAAADFIEHLGEPSAHVVGISFGGMIAQYLAVWHPRVVRSLTLLSTSPAFGLDGTSAPDWQAARLAPLDAGREPADFAGEVLSRLAAPTISPTALATQCAAMSRVSAAALRSSIACIVTHDSRPLLAGIAAPTQCLVGELDAETPPAYSRALAEGIIAARVGIIANAGHLLNAEAPEQVNDRIVRFITAVDAP